MTREERNKRQEDYNALRGKLDKLGKTSIGELLDIKCAYTYDCLGACNGYSFTGKYTDKLVELLGRAPTAYELEILLVTGSSVSTASVCVNTTTRAVVGTVNECTGMHNGGGQRC